MWFLSVQNKEPRQYIIPPYEFISYTALSHTVNCTTMHSYGLQLFTIHYGSSVVSMQYHCNKSLSLAASYIVNNDILLPQAIRYAWHYCAGMTNTTVPYPVAQFMNSWPYRHNIKESDLPLFKHLLLGFTDIMKYINIQVPMPTCVLVTSSFYYNDFRHYSTYNNLCLHCIIAVYAFIDSLVDTSNHVNI